MRKKEEFEKNNRDEAFGSAEESSGNQDKISFGSAEESSGKNEVEMAENEDRSDEKDEKIAELTGDLQRMRADFENYRKQVEMQKEQAKNVVKFTTVLKFLPLIDDIDRAMETYQKELAPLKKTLEKTLKELNLEKIESSEGTDFDPERHEAVMMEDGDGEKEVVALTLRPGYMYEGEVARAAMVKVKRV